jgi:hypothetical protein
LKIQAKAHCSRPLCWYFCWYRQAKRTAANFDIPNERIEQMARKNGGACQRAPKCQHSDRADVRFAPPLAISEIDKILDALPPDPPPRHWWGTHNIRL